MIDLAKQYLKTDIAEQKIVSAFKMSTILLSLNHNSSLT